MSRLPPTSCPLDCKVYIGGLTRTASREEIERAFGHYGKLRNVFVARNPPGFAFVEFEDPQDAEDSVRALDGRMVCGVRVRVEISHGKSRHKGSSFKRGGEPHHKRRSRSIDRRRGSYSRSSSRSPRSRGRETNGRDYRESRNGDRNERSERSDRERDSRRKLAVNRSRSRS